MGAFFQNKKTTDNPNILPTFTPSYDFSAVSEPTKKIVMKIVAILTTMKGKILYQPELGTNVISSIWDLNNKETLRSIESSIRSAFSVINELSIKKLDLKADGKEGYVELIIMMSDDVDLEILLNLKKEGYVSIERINEVTTKYITSDY